MNVKRSLESHIRGWFPKEPNLHINKPKSNHGLVNRRVLVLLSVTIACFVLVVGGVLVLLSWYSEQVLENLKSYSTRLEDAGFTVEPKSLSEFNTEFKHEWYWLGDFRSYAKQENITTIYHDQELKCLYYLTPVSPTNATLGANILYYNRVFE